MEKGEAGTASRAMVGDTVHQGGVQLLAVVPVEQEHNLLTEQFGHWVGAEQTGQAVHDGGVG